MIDAIISFINRIIRSHNTRSEQRKKEQEEFRSFTSTTDNFPTPKIILDQNGNITTSLNDVQRRRMEFLRRKYMDGLYKMHKPYIDTDDLLNF